MADVANLQDFAVTIDGQSYSMIEIPDADSPLVQIERARTLKSVRLDSLLKNLSMTGDLINLAYNATPSKFGELRASIGTLHDGFGKLATKTERQMDELEEATAAILPNLKRVFRFLLDGKEELALKFLQRCADQATQLSRGMAALAIEFDGLGDQASSALGSAETLRGLEQQKIEELKAKAQDLEAKTANAEKLAELLAQAKKSLESKYAEAKEKAETAENRAFALSIVSAIMQPLGEGLGAFAGAYARSQTPGSLPMPTPTPKQKGGTSGGSAGDGKSFEQLQVEKEEAEKKVTEAETKATEAKESAAAAQTEAKKAKEAVTETEAELAKLKEGAPEKESLEKNLIDAKAKQAEVEDKEKTRAAALQDAETALAQAKARAEAIATGLEKLGVAASQVGDNLGQVGDSYFSLADEYRKEKSRYLELLMQKEEEERQALASIKEYAVRMKNIGEQEQSAAVTASALFQAVAALKQVVVILREAARFWSNMAEACNRLADDKIRKDIVDFGMLDLNERLALYREDDFKQQVVRYLAGWKALEVIAKEYARETAEIRDKVYADYGTYLDDAAARALSAKLGEKLLRSTEADLSAKDEYRKEIEVAQREASAPRAAA